MAKKKAENKKISWLVVVVVLVGVLFFGVDPSEVLDLLNGVKEPVVSQVGSFEVFFTRPGAVGEGIESNLIEKIDEAEVSIDMAAFEFDLQNLAVSLIRAHERGVEVRIVYDNDHTEDDPQMDEMIEAGIETLADDRSAFMHNKFVVIDHELVWTGSFNFTENASKKNNENALIIYSEAMADNYTVEFEEMWAGEFGARSPENTLHRVISLDGIEVETWFGPEDEIMDRLVVVASESQESIHFMAFSFTHDDLGQAMLGVMEDGVEVAGIFETLGVSSSGIDNSTGERVYYSECRALLNAGADVYLDGNSDTFHNKVMIIDSEIVITGSFNFSANANDTNDENLLIIYDAEIAALYESEYQRLMLEAFKLSGSECRKN